VILHLPQTVAKWRCIKICAIFFLDHSVYRVHRL